MTATVPDGPFEAAALDACDRDGHPSFRWVPTWGNRGYEECRRCGVHRWVGTKAARDSAIAAGVTHKRAGWADWKVPAAGVAVPVTVELSLGADGMRVDYDGAAATRAALRDGTVVVGPMRLELRSADRGEHRGEPVGRLLHGESARCDGAKDQHQGLGVAHAAQHTRYRGRRRPNPERDAAILTALAAGARVREVAAQHGLTEARIYQIRDKARKAVQS